MPRKILFIVILLFNVSNAFSQDKTREEVLELIAQDTCECIENDKESFSSKISMNKKQMALGLCLLKSYNKRKKESKAFDNEKINNFEKLGEEVGVYMVAVCSDTFMSLFSDDDIDELMEDEVNGVDDMPPPPPAPKNESDLKISAKLVSIHNDAVSYLIFEDDFSKSHTFIISEQFEGIDLLSKANFEKEFTVYFKEKYFYDLSEDRYVSKKVVKYLELQ